MLWDALPDDVQELVLRHRGAMCIQASWRRRMFWRTFCHARHPVWPRVRHHLGDTVWGDPCAVLGGAARVETGSAQLALHTPSGPCRHLRRDTKGAVGIHSTVWHVRGFMVFFAPSIHRVRLVYYAHICFSHLIDVKRDLVFELPRLELDVFPNDALASIHEGMRVWDVLESGELNLQTIFAIKK